MKTLDPATTMARMTLALSLEEWDKADATARGRWHALARQAWEVLDACMAAQPAVPETIQLLAAPLTTPEAPPPEPQPIRLSPVRSRRGRPLPQHKQQRQCPCGRKIRGNAITLHVRNCDYLKRHGITPEAALAAAKTEEAA